MKYWFIILALAAALINAIIAKRKGYFFWRAFLFTLILFAMIGGLLLTNGIELF